MRKLVRSSKFGVRRIAMLLLLTMNYELLTMNCLHAMFDTSLSFSARALGLGGAYLAVSDDASAVNINPAGLSQIENVEFTGNYTPFYDTKAYSQFFSVATPFGYNTFAASFARTGIANIYDEDIYSIGYSRILKEDLFVGLTLKILGAGAAGYSKYNDPAYSGGRYSFAYDIGYLNIINKWFAIGAKLENINEPKIKLLSSSDGEKLASKFKVGMKFTIHKNIFTYDINDFSNLEENLNFGDEIKFSDLLSFRLGMCERTPTAGFGMKLKKVRMDFGFFFHKELGILYRTGITFNL
ncbi:MAG: hypothetical protein HY919_01260 [Elusimicrobia bacterium]|nr:hypothetical protein [Elusimicrobiota bacterium]